MPNERQVATVRLDLQVPQGVRVLSLQAVDGWTATVDRDPARLITMVHWQGQLPPERFAEFGILAVNPSAYGAVSWTATQTYSDGSVVYWNGIAGSKTPAPRTVITPVAAAGDHHQM
jgi:uncharacterized protein YcnI